MKAADARLQGTNDKDAERQQGHGEKDMNAITETSTSASSIYQPTATTALYRQAMQHGEMR
jgi:hypothetical protein